MNTFDHIFRLLMLAFLGMSFPGVCAETSDASAMHSHHHMTEQTKYQTVDSKLPPIQLVRDDGTKVSLIEELNDGRPVIMNFIYTTCTTICPLASHTFAELQDMLGNDRYKVHMVSISIDPEQDTPAVLAKYAGKYGAGKQWRFYTGTKDASIAAQVAFNVYRGDKTNSNPVTFIRAAPDKPWLRIDGFAKSEELFRILRDMGIAESVPPPMEDD
jgi:protein SCO1/2